MAFAALAGAWIVRHPASRVWPTAAESGRRRRTPDGEPESVRSGARRAGEYGYDYDVTRTEDRRRSALDEAVRLKRGAGLPEGQSARELHARQRALPEFSRAVSASSRRRGSSSCSMSRPEQSAPDHFYRRAEPAEGDESHVAGLFGGPWEQDTLVVTTAGFNDRGWLDVGRPPSDGNPAAHRTFSPPRFRAPGTRHDLRRSEGLRATVHPAYRKTARGRYGVAGGRV